MGNFFVDQAMSQLRKIDLNKNGIKDVDEAKALIDQAEPCLLELAKHIDWSKVIVFVVSSFAKNKPQAEQALKQLGEVLSKLQKLLPAPGKP